MPQNLCTSILMENKYAKFVVKGIDTSKAKFIEFKEGLCVQI